MQDLRLPACGVQSIFIGLVSIKWEQDSILASGSTARARVAGIACQSILVSIPLAIGATILFIWGMFSTHLHLLRLILHFLLCAEFRSDRTSTWQSKLCISSQTWSDQFIDGADTSQSTSSTLTCTHARPIGTISRRTTRSQGPAPPAGSGKPTGDCHLTARGRCRPQEPRSSAPH